MGKDGLLDFHKMISDLCGGFVVVDKEGKVAMIYATAREYLFRGDNQDRLQVINKRTTNDKLFKTCILRLVDLALRS